MLSSLLWKIQSHPHSPPTALISTPLSCKFFFVLQISVLLILSLPSLLAPDHFCTFCTLTVDLHAHLVYEIGIICSPPEGSYRPWVTRQLGCCKLIFFITTSYNTTFACSRRSINIELLDEQIKQTPT